MINILAFVPLDLFALTKGMGRDIQDIKSDNRDMRSQLKKNFQAKVDVSDKSHPVFTLSQKYSFPLKNLEDFKKFDDSLVDSVVSTDQVGLKYIISFFSYTFSKFKLFFRSALSDHWEAMI